jgi:hypothetical protein
VTGAAARELKNILAFGDKLFPSLGLGDTGNPRDCTDKKQEKKHSCHMIPFTADGYCDLSVRIFLSRYFSAP